MNTRPGTINIYYGRLIYYNFFFFFCCFNVALRKYPCYCSARIGIYIVYSCVRGGRKSICIFKSSTYLLLPLGDRKPQTMSKEVAANRPGQRAFKENYFAAIATNKHRQTAAGPAENLNDRVIENAFCLSAFIGGAVCELPIDNKLLRGLVLVFWFKTAHLSVNRSRRTSEAIIILKKTHSNSA